MNCESDNIYSLKTLESKKPGNVIYHQGNSQQNMKHSQKEFALAELHKVLRYFSPEIEAEIKSLDSEKILEKNFNMM